MKRLTVLSLFLLSLIINSCEDSSSADCTKGNGNMATRQLSINSFDEFELRGSGNIIYTESDEYDISITTDANIIGIYTGNTFKSGSRLIIDAADACPTSATISISAPKLAEVEIKGSGNISSTGLYLTDNFSAKISGSGNIDISGIECFTFGSEIIGSGTVNATGSADSSAVSIAGSGNILLGGYHVKYANYSVSGSGNIYGWADSTFRAVITGSGNIFYKGNAVHDFTITGSGNIEKLPD